jgi:quinol monooxygenase YgiN
MLILRQKMRAKPDKSAELMAALAKIIAPARATEGVISLDIARVLLEPDSFIATVVYEDAAALERQESRNGTPMEEKHHEQEVQTSKEPGSLRRGI